MYKQSIYGFMFAAAVGVAGTASADVISTTVTSTQFTSNTTGGFEISGTVNVDGGNGIGINGVDAASNTITIDSNGTVQVSGTGAIAISATGDVSAATITNNGDITATDGATQAIDLSPMTSEGSTLENTGNISGSVVLTDAADAISMSAGTIVGNISTTGGADVISQTGGTITGNVDLGAAGDRFYQATANGVSGTLDGGAGTDELEFAADQNVMHSIMGFENVTISNGASITFNTGYAPTDVVNFDTASDTSLIFHDDFAATTSLNISSSYVYIDAGATISSADVNFTNADVSQSLVVAVDGSATTAGTISETGSTGVDLTDATISFDIKEAVADSMTFILVESGGTPVSGTVTDNSYLYDFLTSVQSNDISVTVVRANSLVDATGGSKQTQSLANALDGATGTTGALNDAIESLGELSSAQEVQDSLESLNPNVDGSVVAASMETQGQAMQTVSTRFAKLRGSETGLAAGNGMHSRHMWFQAFGKTADQEKRDGIDGYDVDSFGFTIGFDTDNMVKGATVGTALSYGSADVNSDGAGNASTDVESYQLSFYGERDLGQGMYLNGMVNGALNNYEGQRTIIADGSVANADYDGYQLGARVEGGKTMMYNNTMVTPKAMLHYSYASIDDYTETGSSLGTTVDTETFSELKAGLGVQVAKDYAMDSKTTLRPSLDLMYTYDVMDDEAQADATFIGTNVTFSPEGIDDSPHALKFGAGLGIMSTGGLDFNLNYEGEARADYLSHTGMLKARFAF